MVFGRGMEKVRRVSMVSMGEAMYSKEGRRHWVLEASRF